MHVVYLWNPRSVGLYNKTQGWWPISEGMPFNQCEQYVKDRINNGFLGDYTIYHEPPDYTNNAES